MIEPKKTTPVAPQPEPQKQINKKVDYKNISKKSLIQNLKETFPRTLIPTKRFGAIFGAIFVLGLIISGLQFPFASLMAGNMETTIDLGYPLHFLELGIKGDNDSPFLPLNFFLDFIMYLILAYVVDILLKLILNNGLFKSEEKLEEKPTIFKNKKQTTPKNIQETV